MISKQPEIRTLEEKTLVGMHKRMSLADDRTVELWRTFMPRRGEIGNRSDTDFVSMQVYDEEADVLSPDTAFDKWAVVAVDDCSDVPDGMETYVLRGGRYAVFIHEGPASNAPEVFGYIFGQWLPASGYELDAREHFEVLPENYSPVDPAAREEIWIPLK